jgi:hypothetical protein
MTPLHAIYGPSAELGTSACHTRSRARGTTTNEHDLDDEALGGWLLLDPKQTKITESTYVEPSTTTELLTFTRRSVTTLIFMTKTSKRRNDDAILVLRPVAGLLPDDSLPCG